jgi:alkanesulfonate monooxygenase SsuD/methylene tetrahydromethanopterin reductase-like flavin-dependent oxidoreductase (luciferase family)
MEDQEGAMPALGFGVHLISRGEGDPATTPFPSHRVMTEDGVRVERLGFDATWLPDHYYVERASGLETFPEVWTLLTAIAVKTERIMLGTNVLAATFLPGQTAKMAGAIRNLRRALPPRARRRQPGPRARGLWPGLRPSRRPL